MALGVSGLNFGQADMSVDLGSFQLLMTKHFLDVTNIATVLVQCCGKGVPEDVTTPCQEILPELIEGIKIIFHSLPG